MRRLAPLRLVFAAIPMFLLAVPVAAQSGGDSASNGPGGGAAKPAPTRLQARVWVNASSGVYHCPGSRYYGKTKGGEYMSEAQARGKGMRASGGAACAGDTPAAEGVASAVKVWVNSSSNVYHCPGASAYGNTKSGEYMTQAEAKAAGKRAAGGRECK